MISELVVLLSLIYLKKVKLKKTLGQKNLFEGVKVELQSLYRQTHTNVAIQEIII